jgi:hypothetical protein
MKLRHFLALFAAISFLFVVSTQNMYASDNSRELLKPQKDNSKTLNQIDQDIQVQLLKSDVIQSHEDGGGYFSTYYLLVLVLIVVLIVILIR